MQPTGSTSPTRSGGPLISIITATLNAKQELPRLIECLRAQSDRNFEWIIADGMSTDGTVELLEASEDIVTRLVSESDFGIYDALNKAIHLSAGEYYLVLGADDMLLPNAIAQYRIHAAYSEADLVTASILLDGRVSKGKLGRSWWNGMFAYVSGHSVGTLIRRSLHDRFGYYSRRFPIAADMYFIKSAAMSPNIRIHIANFIAGEHGKAGISSVDKAATFCDCFRVQLETEPGKILQVFLFIAKIIWRMPVLIRQRSQSNLSTSDTKQ